MRSPAAALDAVPRPGPPTPAGVQLARRLATASGCHRHDCHTPSRVVVPGTPDPPPTGRRPGGRRYGPPPGPGGGCRGNRGNCVCGCDCPHCSGDHLPRGWCHRDAPLGDGPRGSAPPRPPTAHLSSTRYHCALPPVPGWGRVRCLWHLRGGVQVQQEPGRPARCHPHVRQGRLCRRRVQDGVLCLPPGVGLCRQRPVCKAPVDAASHHRRPVRAVRGQPPVCWLDGLPGRLLQVVWLEGRAVLACVRGLPAGPRVCVWRLRADAAADGDTDAGHCCRPVRAVRGSPRVCGLCGVPGRLLQV